MIYDYANEQIANIRRGRKNNWLKQQTNGFKKGSKIEIIILDS